MFACTASVLVIAITAILSSAVFVSAKELPEFRLPQNLRPISYDLTQRIVLDENKYGFQVFTSRGNVTIRFNCTEATRNITLNVQFIEIQESLVKVVDYETKSSIPIEKHSYDSDLQFYTIHTSQPLEAGRQYSTSITFLSQILTNDTFGLYRGYYNDSLDGNLTKNLSTTFFQPLGARRGFPCFDEPDLKSVFNIRIGREKKYHTLSNMDLNNTVADPNYEGWEWDQFNPTVEMSTYLVCFIVSDFKYVEADPTIFPGKPVKVWGTPAVIEEGGGKFAADTSASLLKWLETYTGIPYVFPKMDSVAVPQFQAGAMENWGLNTYRDYLLIYKPERDPDFALIEVAEILSHELSHQWFGNLATCKWWDQIWLNEGLTAFTTYKALLSIRPEFDIELRYLTGHKHLALKIDSNPNRTQALVLTADTLDVFKGSSFETGGALTRMMEYAFTKPCFERGLRLYLHRAAYKGAVQDDLFQAMQESIEHQNMTNVLPPGTTVKEVMEPFTIQTGYPLIRVRRDNSSLILTQGNIIPSQSNHSWWVPIKVVTQNNPSFASDIPDLWIPPTEVSANYSLNGDNHEGWVIVNPNSAGYYRVLYEDHLWDLIGQQLLEDPNSFTDLTRAQLIDDAFSLGMLELVPPSYTINVINYIHKETSTGVLISALKNIVPFLRRFQAHPSLVNNRFLTQLEKLQENMGGFEPASLATTTKSNLNILRNDLLNALCEFGSDQCGTLSREFLKIIKTAPLASLRNVIPINVQDSMYCGMVANCGDEAYAIVENLFATVSNLWSSKYLAKALGCTTNSELIERTLTKVTNKSLWGNKMDYRYRPLAELVKSKAGREAYFKSALVHSEDPEDIKLVKSIARFLQENYGFKTNSQFIVNLNTYLLLQL